MDTAAKRRKLQDQRASSETESRTYTAQRVLGKGSFAVVYQAQVIETLEIVAIKSIKAQEVQQRDREVQILKELDGHPNIVHLKGAFLSSEGGSEARLNLVLEFLADTLHRVIKHYNQRQLKMDPFYVKLYTYQLLRGLGYIHGKGIVHCDIKPQNLLFEGKTHCMKICDFGTAKRMVFGEQNRPYVCSRFYRAPELSLGSTCYTTSVDLWSAGCVLAEMILGQPIFTGSNGVQQLVEIVKVLGTPTSQDLKAMNPNYDDYVFKPEVAPLPWPSVFIGFTTSDTNELVSQLLRYDPQSRLPALQCLLHYYFDELRFKERPEYRYLFSWMPDELLWCEPDQRQKLTPKWANPPQAS
eukprot:gnl/TRDRNA2_/TRDRNA2_42713_c0_seq1.p1 gnl/TRDRNA2_/TRDRNA2_42713_c0~~gnl/TRDRNA2_/TRDRNA2_42713_c0_seq1.p1  ORF type:complete len:371 (-),score=66.14 gnl/TRDRNA2_/TRDRNA2_42713_c0_seq1:168-1232(-)